MDESAKHNIQGDKGILNELPNETLHDESSVSVSEKAKRKVEDDDEFEEDRHRKKKKKSKDRERKHKDKDREERHSRKRRDSRDREKRDRSPDRRDRSNARETNDRRDEDGDDYRGGRKTSDTKRSDDRKRRSRSYDYRSRRSNDRKYRDRSRERNYRRESRSRSHERSSHKSSRSRDDEKRKSNDDSLAKNKTESGGDDSYKPITLKDVMSANPGITLPEAVIRLNAYNSAVAKGEKPPPLSGNQLQSSVNAAVLPSGLPVSVVSNLGILPDGGALTKPHRELYVGNLPPGITVPQLAEFMNSAMKQMGLAKDLSSVVTAWVSPDGHYAFVELRSVEEATAALTYLNGIQVGAYGLKIGRPKGYNGGSSSVLVPMQASLPTPTTGPLGLAGLANGGVIANPLLSNPVFSLGGSLSGEPLSNVIMVTNLPALISEEQIKELFVPFGELKAFNIIKTGGQNQSAVLEYKNPEIIDGVIAGMNNIDIAGSRLTVQRVPESSASVLLKPTVPSSDQSAQRNNVHTESIVDNNSNVCDKPTSVVFLSNMTTEEDLVDNQLYEELIEDISEECNNYATVNSVIIPRDRIRFDESLIGKVFVHVTNAAGAESVFKAVNGRKFNGKIVVATYYKEDSFLKEILQSTSTLVNEDLD